MCYCSFNCESAPAWLGAAASHFSNLVQQFEYFLPRLGDITVLREEQTIIFSRLAQLIYCLDLTGEVADSLG